MSSFPDVQDVSSAGDFHPQDVIAFRATANAAHCLIGVVASTPTVQQSDGTTAVLVQTRPLILVPPQPPSAPPGKKLKTVKLTGQLVDRVDPAVAPLAVTPIPSPAMSRIDVAAKAEAFQPDPVVTTEELREMQEQRQSLQADLDTSRARVKEIDALLKQNAINKKKNNNNGNSNSNPAASAQQQQRSSPANTPRPSSGLSPAAAQKRVEDAVKATEAAERELLLSRAGLRTAKSTAWTDLQRRTQRTSTPLLVGLIETSALLLHDAKSSHFDDVVQQSATLAKRLAAVKSRDVTENDRTRAHSFLRTCPTTDLVEKEHKTASALYRWLAAVTRAAQALKDLRDAQRVVSDAPSAAQELSASILTPAGGGKSTESPDPVARDLDVLTSGAENALRNERNDQLEYVQMAEEEIAALDALIDEANTLAQPRSTSPPEALNRTNSFPGEAQGSPTIVPALTVPVSWVVCVFAPSDAPDMEACVEKPRGTPVAFSLPARHKLVLAVQGASEALSAEDTPAAVTSARGSGRKSKGSARQAKKAVKAGDEDGDDEGEDAGRPSSLPPTMVSSHRNSANVVVSPRPSAPSAKPPSRAPALDDAAGVPNSPRTSAAAAATAPPSPGHRESELEEKVRLLEARLSAALMQNPKEAELQLLRDEVNAKLGELQRVTEERDRLLLERREKSMWGNYGSVVRRGLGGGPSAADNNNNPDNDARGGSSSSPLQHQSGSGLYTRQASTPRDMVDRSIVDELEEQLTAAHQRISELQIEASQVRKRPTASMPPVNAADSVVVPLVSVGGATTTTEGDGTEVTASRAASPPAEPRTVAQQLYDELEARLQSASAALEAQQQSTQKLEEQLNSALHRRTEAETVVAAQKRELEEVWERLEAAEARAEEHSLLTEQRLIMAQAQQNATAQQQQQQQQQQEQQGQVQNAAASSISTAGTSYHSPQQAGPLSPSGLPRPPAQPTTPTTSQQDGLASFVIPPVVETEAKSQQNDDAATVVTNTGYGNVSRLSFDAVPRGTSAEAFPTFYGGGGGGSGGSGLAHGSPDPLLHAGPYSRGASAALQSRPVEQLSTIELRHEVHRLREEVERHQSGELRLAMELQTIREKQKAEHKRRRDARVARMQMLTRMQDNITEAIEKSNQDLEAIPALLDRGRAEAEALMLKRRMNR